MSKNIYINSAQAKLIKESVNCYIPKHIEQELDEYISENNLTDSVCRVFLKKCLQNREKTLIDNFNNDISNIPLPDVWNKLNTLTEKCRQKEESIRGQLIKICENTLYKLFNIPKDCMCISLKLIDKIPEGEQFHIKPDTNEDYEYNDIEEYHNIEDEIIKRRLLSTFVMGASLCMAEKAKKLYLNDLFNLDETLPHLYSLISKLNSYIIFKSNIAISDKKHHQGGYVTVHLGTEEKIPTVDVTATSFISLLTEAIRGILELSSSHTLPNDFKERNYVINKADVLEKEPFNTNLGPELWLEFSNGIESKYVPRFLTDLFSRNLDEIIYALSEVGFRTKMGKKIVNYLKNKAKHDTDYECFENDLLSKKDIKTVV